MLMSNRSRVTSSFWCSFSTYIIMNALPFPLHWQFQLCDTHGHADSSRSCAPSHRRVLSSWNIIIPHFSPASSENWRYFFAQLSTQLASAARSPLVNAMSSMHWSKQRVASSLTRRSERRCWISDTRPSSSSLIWARGSLTHRKLRRAHKHESKSSFLPSLCMLQDLHTYVPISSYFLFTRG